MCVGVFLLKLTQIHFGGKAHGQARPGVQNLAATLPSGQAASASKGGLVGSVSQLCLLLGERGGGDALSLPR